MFFLFWELSKLLFQNNVLGPIVQSIVSLMFVSGQNVNCSSKYKNISVYAIFNDYSFNDMLTNDIVSFEQLGPEFFAP